jgi:AhpC/TSA family
LQKSNSDPSAQKVLDRNRDGKVTTLMVNKQRSTLMRTLPLCGLLLTLLAPPSIVCAKDPPKADLSLKDLDGKRVHLRDLRGKIVVLNFWAPDVYHSESLDPIQLDF